jgi:Polyketide cyclase / dehydrase and lipid transport
VSLRLTASAQIRAAPARVWTELTDWAGQRRWIPFTTVRVAGPATGIGVRAEALSGFWLGRVPVGLLDRFVVTDWTPPGSRPGQLEVLHLGPYFAGPGVFTLTASATGTRVDCVELFDLPGGRVTETPARLLLPVMSAGFGLSLRRLAALCED